MKGLPICPYSLSYENQWNNKMLMILEFFLIYNRMLVKLFYKLVMSLVHFSLNHHFLLVLLWRKIACLSQLKNQRFICKLVKRPCDERATAPVTVCNFFFQFLDVLLTDIT